jgi:hypothetical protein
MKDPTLSVPIVPIESLTKEEYEEMEAVMNMELYRTESIFNDRVLAATLLGLKFHSSIRQAVEGIVHNHLIKHDLLQKPSSKITKE